jgi:hypothetical protein
MGIGYNTFSFSNGLIFCYDARNTKSYSGSGTTFNDIGGGLTSSSGSFASYNLNPGHISFNGSNGSGIQFPSSSIHDTQTPSVEVWVRTNALSQNGFWFEKGTVNTQYSLFQEGGVIQWRQYFTSGQGLTNLSTTTSSYITTGVWYQVVGTFTAGSRKLYINGSLVNSDTQSGTINTGQAGIGLGSFGGGNTGYQFNGDLAIVKAYNVELSASQVLQNFNALRGRFGI